MLKKLHESGEYARIIVVGHSLGSVIGYDILTYAWPEYARKADLTKPNPALDEIENTIQQTKFDIDKFQVDQRKLEAEQRANGCGWLVTDFVTAGCPLTHSELLLAYDAADLRRPVALVLGNEAHGLPAGVVLDELVTIPMAGSGESLNVGMAAAVLAFEVARQRRRGGPSRG